MLKLGTVRQHGRLLRQTSRYSLPGSKGDPSPRADSFPGLEMRARGAPAKKVLSYSTVPSSGERFARCSSAALSSLGALPPRRFLRHSFPPTGILGALSPTGILGTLPPTGILGTLPPTGILGTLPPPVS